MASTPDPIPHEELRGLLAAEALDALDGAERQELLAHLEGCAECRAELAELRDAAGAMAYAAPPARLDPARSARVRARLLVRAAADGRAAPRRWRGLTTGLGWATAAGLATLLLTHHSFHRPLNLGWVAAAALGVALFLVGGYAAAQRRELRVLRKRLDPPDAGRP